MLHDLISLYFIFFLIFYHSNINILYINFFLQNFGYELTKFQYLFYINYFDIPADLCLHPLKLCIKIIVIIRMIFFLIAGLEAMGYRLLYWNVDRDQNFLYTCCYPRVTSSVNVVIFILNQI